MIEKQIDFKPLFQRGLTLNKEFGDFDEMAQSALYWNNEYHKLNTKPFGGFLKILHTSNIQIADVRWSSDICITGQNPTNTIVLVIPITSNPIIWLGEKLASNEVMIIKNNDAIDYQTINNCHVLLTSINAELLENYWQIYHHESFLDNIRSKSKLKVESSEIIKLLAQEWNRYLELGFSHKSDLDNKTLDNSINDELLSNFMLNTEINAGNTQFQKSERIAKEARDYIFANINKPISIIDLCINTNSSKRTLHHGFKSLYGYSPVSFLKRLRLNNVRHELLNPTGNTTVTDIAFKWKFYHLSRFAKDYYTMFGEKPSETLKRSIQFKYINY